MRYRFVLSVLLLALLAGVQPAVAAPFSQTSRGPAPAVVSSMSAIQTVFIILMENHNWADIHGSASAPYINTLLPLGAHAEQYFNPPGNHPSEPNYLWLEAGTNFGIRDDAEPAMNHQSTSQHLTGRCMQNGGHAAQRAMSASSAFVRLPHFVGARHAAGGTR